jgi:hypothetical protein
MYMGLWITIDKNCYSYIRYLLFCFNQEKVSNNLNKPLKLPILLNSFDDDDDDDEETIHQKVKRRNHSLFISYIVQFY